MLYPIAIEKGDENNAFGVVVPDVPGCFSAGDNFEEALVNAKEAIEVHFEALAEEGGIPPTAASIENYINLSEYQGWVWALVDIDLEPYMGKSSKINVTLPNLLTKKIDDFVKANPNYKSRSHFLQLAASHEFEKKHA
ncbi:MAG: type II toxin-antitoxin system HicB family antitoxin [Alkalimonas sp.]|nr:type II toxin-antitoxin system HicB family antitoxin [Alkalimonas sp.]